jgi:L-ascorbate metabolism protein UlaG (beta-lactamase superfamily)
MKFLSKKNEIRIKSEIFLVSTGFESEIYYIYMNTTADTKMKIRKIGHCCLVIEVKGKRILTDPGSFTIEGQSSLTNIDFVLFTHEHGDHYHLDSLKTIMKNNPQAIVYANSSVSDLLAKEEIAHVKISDGERVMLSDIALDGIGEKHAELHSSIPVSENLGFFIDERLWYPGDAFTDPKRAVDILALPVAGPWLKISESIDYALALKPKIIFPVHDGNSKSPGIGSRLGAMVFDKTNIKFVSMSEGDEKEL